MKKPECELIGEDGNVFFIIGRVVKTLRRAGLYEQADEFNSKYPNCQSYDEVLRLAMDYVEIV
ncbi:MAG: hypothetical protein HFI31_14825 [Lachnospiraceae bacterium]|nr:hypothetical protein [Lachnospiraceae bacterium]